MTSCDVFLPFSGDASSVQQDNPLYGEEELRVDLFQPPSDDETEGKLLVIDYLLYILQVMLMKADCSGQQFTKRMILMMMTLQLSFEHSYSF